LKFDKIIDIFSQFGPILEGYCVSALEIDDETIEVINEIEQKIEIIRVAKGENATDIKLLEKAGKILSYDVEYVIILSGDHIFTELIPMVKKFNVNPVIIAGTTPSVSKR
jgi:hypothetical protein